MRHLGIDLAWASTTRGPVNETGVVALDDGGVIAAAGWTVGIQQTVAWIAKHATPDTLAFTDAPLVVENEDRQRLCEKHVGQAYWKWKVSANSTNKRSPRLAGVELRRELERLGWIYDDGLAGPPRAGWRVSECYPYTTLVGARELGYELERPGYKRCPPRTPMAQFRPIRARACDLLISRLETLARCDPPLNLRSHPETARLLDEPSPLNDREYKHREDLIDAALCAWTAALWHRFGTERCQVLGRDDASVDGRIATIIAPARAEQRRPDQSEQSRALVC